MVGSKEAQEAFNALKGSIPVRTDVDKSKLSAVVDGVVSSRRIVGELRAWRSGPGHLSARIERCDQYVCGRQERGALYGGACAGCQSVRFVKIGAREKWETL
jgi:hypothetical protein